MSKSAHDLTGVLTEKGLRAFQALAGKYNPPLQPSQITLQALMSSVECGVGELLTQGGLLAMIKAMRDLDIGRDSVTVQHLITYLRDTKKEVKPG